MHLMGDIDGAIEAYHQALSLLPDDTFSNEMLNRALREDATHISPNVSSRDNPPQKKSENRLSIGSARGQNAIDQSAMSSSMITDQSSRFNMDCSASDFDITMS